MNAGVGSLRPPVKKTGLYWTVRRLVSDLALAHRKPALLQVLLTLVVATLPSVQIAITRHLFDRITAALAGQRLWPVAVLLGLQGLILAGLTGLAEWKGRHLAWLQEHLTLSLKEPLLAKAQRLELTQFEQPRYYDLQRRAQMAVDQGTQLMVSLLQLLESAVTTVAYMVVMANLLGLVALFLPVLTIPSLWLGASVANWSVQIHREMTPMARALTYLENLLTSRNAAKEIRIYQTYDYFLTKFRQLFWAGAHERRRIATVQMHSVIKRSLFDQLLSVLVTLFALWLAIGRQASLGVYVALTQAIGGAQSTVERFVQMLVGIYKNHLHMEDYDAFLALPEALQGPSHPFLGPDGRVESICVDDLSFTYPGREEPALREIGFQVKRGEIVAIVGENGSGKTTLAKCLLGLYRLADGSITYNGVDLATVPQETLFAKISALFQDFTQYELTARENIALGNVELLMDERAIGHAIEAAQLQRTIQQLPHGLDTELGVMFGTGKELSLGQWQRFALARVFLKDADVILLDEPTASLDPKSELALFQRVREVYQGDRILFLISHRLGICREVDRILVLQEGRLVEQGHHMELMALDGVYAQMFRGQASLYTESNTPWAESRPAVRMR